MNHPINEQTINAYKLILNDPKEYGCHFPALNDIVEKSDTPISKALCYTKYIQAIGVTNLQKVIFYIIFDELFDVKPMNGDLGYCVKFKI